jgi:hypothetical protein
MITALTFEVHAFFGHCEGVVEQYIDSLRSFGPLLSFALLS